MRRVPHTQLSKYNLTLKETPEEVITWCYADSLSEAIFIHACTKQLRPDQLLEIYSVYEQSSNGE